MNSGKWRRVCDPYYGSRITNQSIVKENQEELSQTSVLVTEKVGGRVDLYTDKIENL